ncbi:FAD-dependent oxidoreductase [Psychrobacter cryohalolentis]|uniref:NAD(P)/FAD-dependent oxidoreductase n=1 Tax=Psychrobacter sp. D2 TaxID=2759702 RepID=UPI0015E6021D|nr:FAD-dependent oxidoreductase [Psychrobacter sp. D2]MBA2058717.1 FAD-dependent oxidoreductase [Psychrobacter sp. D2]
MPFLRRKSKQLSNQVEAVVKATSRHSEDKNDAQVRKSIAIIGSGVSGLTCAHYLATQFDVTIFEASDYIGGHVNTIDVTLQDGKKAKPNKVEKSAIDTGFIVFNERTYPNFFRLLHELQVPFQATDMSFSVKNAARHFEYNGHTLNTLLSQRKNLLNPKFWGFINDILQFNKQVRQLRQDYDKAREQGQDIAVFTKQTLGEYLDTKKYGDLFTGNYLLPMVSAIWSTSLRDVRDFPLVFFAQFFDNHGLLDVVNRPQWFTIKGGSKQYVNKLIRRFVKAGGSVRVNSPVQSVTRKDNKVILSVTDTTDNKAQGLVFDEVIFACHADTALKILQDANPTEQEVLNHFTFTDNTAVLHTDTSVLPKKPLAWASWNYLIDDKNTIKKDKESLQTATKPVLTYHMNILQRLTKQHNYLVTLNHEVDESQVIKRIDYSHPVFNNEMIAAQAQWSNISGSSDSHTHFCGAYWFNGFHEDGVRSALRVCQALGCNIDIKDSVDPSHLPDAESAHTPFRYKDLPVKADKQLRKLKKRQLVTATTNQELVQYIAMLAPAAKAFKKKKLGFFAARKDKHS